MLKEEDLIPGTWYTTTDTDIHICFKQLLPNGRIAASAYIVRGWFCNRYGETITKPTKKTDPNILAKHGLSKPCITFLNAEIVKIHEFTDFNNKIKFSIC